MKADPLDTPEVPEGNDARQTIAAFQNELSPQALHAVHVLYDAEQRQIASGMPPLASDLAYGPDERHRLDLYAPPSPNGPLPVLVWAHGGGFRRGSKGGGETWQDAQVGRMAAQEGMLGTVINYRLAPQHRWPAGSEDLARTVEWLKREVGSFGGDPHRIFLAGTSAGAAHVAGYIKLRPAGDEIAGAIMLSGIYGVTSLSDERDFAYFGDDSTAHAAMLPLEAVTATSIPLFVACGEFDPPRFQAEFVGLLQRRLERHQRLPRAYVALGHNHFSLAYHLGTSDRRLTDEIVSFVRTT